MSAIQHCHQVCQLLCVGNLGILGNVAKCANIAINIVLGAPLAMLVHGGVRGVSPFNVTTWFRSADVRLGIRIEHEHE